MTSGSSAKLNASSSFNLGQLTDLKFGPATDFTISFWVRAPNAWTGDPSFISNKNWSSGANTAWILAAASSARGWQWNFKGATLARSDFDPAASSTNLSDGNWHLITASHKRNGNATFYHDGLKIGENSILSPADVAVLYQGEISSVAFDARRDGNFSEEELGLPSVSGPLVDPDMDGVANLLEFASGGDPHGSPVDIPLLILESDSGRELRWPQMNGGVGANGSTYIANGVRYRIETSELSPSEIWQDAGPHFSELDPPVFSCDGYHCPRLRIATAEGKRFFRLSVSR